MTRWLRAVLSGTVFGIAVAGMVVLTGPDASAKGAYESAYGFDRTWNAGVRLVRIDLGMKVTEKDDATGYLMFDYKSPEGGNKTVPGSMEFVRIKDSGAVRVFVQIPAMPGYHEQVMVDSLQKKLRAEYGDPPAHPVPPATPKDGGVDASTSFTPSEPLP